MRYAGTIIRLLESGNCGFIDLKSVTNENGSTHGLTTSGDIFVHKDDCAGLVLAEQMGLFFEVTPDNKRGDGFLRAVNVLEAPKYELVLQHGEAAVPGLALFASVVPDNTTALVIQTDRSPHAFMKMVPRDLVERVHQNSPLNGLPHDNETVRIEIRDGNIDEVLEGYLRSQEPEIANVDGVSTALDTNETAEQAVIDVLLEAYRGIGSNDQATETETKYKGFVATKKILRWVRDRGFLSSGTALNHISLTTIIKVAERLDGSKKDELLLGVKEAIDFMDGHGLLYPSTVVPMRLLPDLYMACPVWFTYTTNQGMSNEWKDKYEESDPLPTKDTEFFCNLVEGQRWADVFQLFNRRMRLMGLYKGEQIPMPLIRLMKEAAGVFDYVVVATPYHDVAGREWQDPEWQRAIDPYILGFKKGLPVFFVLGRFSGTGVFPLINELVGDTIDYLKKNAEKTTGFSCPFWFVKDWDNQTAFAFLRNDYYLRSFVEAVLVAFEADRLFDWLRGEWDIPETTIVPTPSAAPAVDSVG